MRFPTGCLCGDRGYRRRTAPPRNVIAKLQGVESLVKQTINGRQMS
jgi:hypothetical protein